MEKVVEHILKLLEEDSKLPIMFHKFPIQTIHRVDVFISLEFINDDRPFVRFNIEAKNVDFDDADYHLYCKVLEQFETPTTFTSEMITKYMQEIIDIMPTLKLDKFDAKLTNKFVFEDEQYIELFKFENVTLKYDICSVCMDLCGTVTECKHHLCIACCSQMSEKEHECDWDGCEICGKKSCPVCRADFDKLIKT